MKDPHEKDMTKLSSKEIILQHLRKNRGREIPVSEIREKYGIKRTTISNAIKELELKEIIKIERRPLRRGRYTVISLSGDVIEERYVHPKETEESKKQEPKIPKFDDIDLKINENNVNETIKYLYSSMYNQKEFVDKLNQYDFNKIELVFNFLKPILDKTGNLWHANELTTAQEHLITSRLEKVIIEMIPHVNNTNSQGTIILTVVEGEMHDISLLLLELLLADKFKILNLRRSLPISSIVQFLGELNEEPDWIFISISQSNFIGTLKRQIQQIKSSITSNTKIAIGGSASSNVTEIEDIEYIMGDDIDLIAFLKRIKEE